MIFVIGSFNISVNVSLHYDGISKWVVLMWMSGHFGSVLFLELFAGDPIECPNKGTVVFFTRSTSCGLKKIILTKFRHLSGPR